MIWITCCEHVWSCREKVMNVIEPSTTTNIQITSYLMIHFNNIQKFVKGAFCAHNLNSEENWNREAVLSKRILSLQEWSSTPGNGGFYYLHCSKGTGIYIVKEGSVLQMSRFQATTIAIHSFKNVHSEDGMNQTSVSWTVPRPRAIAFYWLCIRNAWTWSQWLV